MRHYSYRVWNEGEYGEMARNLAAWHSWRGFRLFDVERCGSAFVGSFSADWTPREGELVFRSRGALEAAVRATIAGLAS